MNNKNILLGVLIVAVIAITTGFFVLASKKVNPRPAVDTTAMGNTTQPAATSTQTATTATTSKPTNTATDPYPGWKTYQNNHFGIVFRYPAEYLLKSEGYNSVGAYNATFDSINGNIILSVDKKLTDPSKERLQSKTVTIGGKEGTLFTSRKDVCDVAVARTQLDSEYGVQLSFESCGSSQKLFSDTKTIDSIVKSIVLGNKNTNVFVSTQSNIAFRYFTAGGKPVQKASQFSVGKNMTISVGPIMSTTTKKNLTFTEAVTAAAKVSNTTNTPITIDGKQGQRLTHTPTTGPKEVTIYIEGKTPTEIITLKQTGVDTADLDLAAVSFKFIK